MSNLRETLHLQLARFDDDAFAALANRGLLRRARKDLEKETPEIVEESSTRMVMRFGGQRIEFDSRGPSEARCTCPSRSGCRHILAAAIGLGSPAPATGAAPEGSTTADQDLRQPLIQALLDLTPQTLRKHSGKAGYRWAWQFVQDLDIQNDLTLTGERNIVITFRHPPVSFRYMGGSVDALLSDADIKQIAKYRVAAVLAFQRASGQALEPPEETTPRAASLNFGKDHAPEERGSAALSEQRARLLAAVCQLARECVTLGLAHSSSGIHERFATLAVWAQGAQLYRLALLLRRIADHVDMLLERAGGADEQRLFDELTLTYALASALQGAAEDGKSPAALVGRARTEYEEVGPLELLGLGTSAWRSASGYLGLTMLFWSPSQRAFLSCTDARPEMQRFDPVARYKAAGPWSGLGAPAMATGRKLMLTGAMLSAGGRISASDKTHATFMPADAAAVNDELNAATNYPLVRITNTASGHVVYARTHNHSSMGVATGSAIVSTQFDVPAGTERRRKFAGRRGQRHRIGAAQRDGELSARTVFCELVGPLGLEPRTKGFTFAPPFPEGVDYLFTPMGCGTL